MLSSQEGVSTETFSKETSLQVMCYGYKVQNNEKSQVAFGMVHLGDKQCFQLPLWSVTELQFF